MPTACSGSAAHAGASTASRIRRKRIWVFIVGGDDRQAQSRGQDQIGGARLLAFQRLTFEFGPNDSALAEVHFYLAESYFQTGDRVQAAHEFRQTADQYPTSAYAAVALLRAGDANLRLWRRPDLDPAYGEAALAIYQELAGRYPDTDAAKRAQLHVHQLKEWFADKSYRNGMFYFRRNAWD